MNKKFALGALTVLLLMPVIGLAQITFPSTPSLSSGVNLFNLIVTITTIVLNAVWMIAVTFVIVMFVISGFQFLTAQGDPGKVGEARNAIIWGTGGVVVIILSYSILVIMRLTLGI